MTGSLTMENLKYTIPTTVTLGNNVAVDITGDRLNITGGTGDTVTLQGTNDTLAMSNSMIADETSGGTLTLASGTGDSVYATSSSVVLQAPVANAVINGSHDTITVYDNPKSNVQIAGNYDTV